jgi:hypothetical protein
MKKTYVPLLAGIALTILTGAASAAINTPPGLQPGDTFHLMFVTTGTMQAVSSNPPGFAYDQLVFNEAQAKGLLTYGAQSVNWTALISHWDIPVVGAIDRFDPVSPVYRLDGPKIANNGSDLYDSSIQNPINVGPDLSNNDVFVWTGSNADGMPAGNGSYLNNGFNNPRIGVSFNTNLNWLSATDFPWNTEMHLYAFSSELTAVPEPGAAFLGCIATVGVLAALRRRPAMRLAATRSSAKPTTPMGSQPSTCCEAVFASSDVAAPGQM